jgi:hypothetical protein
LDPNAPAEAPAAPEIKEPQSAEELMKSLSSISTGDISKLNMEELKGLAGDDKTYEGKSCDSIKKMGQQKDYCEKKYLLSEGEEKTVECMKAFCTDCCRGVESCEEKCHKSHAMFGDHDPEEMLISVCSYKDQGPQFKGFCKSMLTESDPKEYDNCLTNFCFDCCSNELKINDQNDPEVMKCLDGCKPPKPKQEDEHDGDGHPPVPGTKEADMLQADKDMMEASQKIDNDTQKEKDSLIKDLKKDNGKEEEEEIKVLADFGGKKHSEEMKSEEDNLKPKDGGSKSDEKENLLIDFEKQAQEINRKLENKKSENSNKEKSSGHNHENSEKSEIKREKKNIHEENQEKDEIPKSEKIKKDQNSNDKKMKNNSFPKTIKKRVNKNDSLEQAKLEKLHEKKDNRNSEMDEAEKMFKKEKSHKSQKSHIKVKKFSFSERTKGT